MAEFAGLKVIYNICVFRTQAEGAPKTGKMPCVGPVIETI